MYHLFDSFKGTARARTAILNGFFSSAASPESQDKGGGEEKRGEEGEGGRRGEEGEGGREGMDKNNGKALWEGMRSSLEHRFINHQHSLLTPPLCVVLVTKNTSQHSRLRAQRNVMCCV